MSDNSSSSNSVNQSDLKMQVELDYTAALAALQAFDGKVEAVENRGVAMANLQQAMMQSMNQLREAGAAFNTMALEAQKLADNLGKAKTQAGELEGETDGITSKARVQARQDIQDAQYLNATLERRLQLMQQIAVATQNATNVSTLNAAMQAELTKRFGTAALADYDQNGGALGFARLQQQVEAERAAQAEMAQAAAEGLAARESYEALWGKLLDQRDLKTRESALKEDAVLQAQNANMTAHVAAYQASLAEKDAADKAYTDLWEALLQRRDLAERAQAAKQDANLQAQNANMTAHVAAYQASLAAQAAADDSYVALWETLLQKRDLREREAEAKREAALTDLNARMDSHVALYRVQLEGKAAADAAYEAMWERLLQQRELKEREAEAKRQVRVQAAIAPRYDEHVYAYQQMLAAQQDDATGAKGQQRLVESAARREALELERTKAKETYAAYEELKGAARGGLAGTGGPLWLTYGAMVPMAASAAVGGMMAAEISQGSKFIENMAFVKELSRDTAPSLNELNLQVQDISKSLLDMASNSRFSAVEMSASMRQIAQAGYNPNQARQILPAANNLALVGETTPDKAALSISGQLNAFGLSAEDASRVANVTAMAAAKSPAGVLDMMEAMKQASSVAKDYGSSLEETAAVVSLLAQRNITGSAAGTAYRNMLEDLAGRSTKGTAALKELGIELYDHTTQKARATKDVLNDLIAALAQLNQHQQNYYLSQITTDRGRKAFSAVLAAGPDGLSGRIGELQDAQANGGYAANVAKNLDDTPIALYKETVNALTSSLIEGFLDAQGSVKDFLQVLHDGFASNEFKDFVRDMTEGLVHMAEIMAKLAPYAGTVLEVFTAYAGAKAAAAVLSLLNSGLATNVTWLNLMPAAHAKAVASQAALTAEMEAGTVAATAERVALQEGVAFLTGPWGLAIAAATTAWILFGDSAEDAARKASRGLQHQDMSSFASDHTQAYQDLKKESDTYYAALVENSTKYPQLAAKSEADVLANATNGEQALAALREKMASQHTASNLALKQALLDEETKFYQGLLDQATKYYDGSAKSKEDLDKLEVQYANERVRVQNEMFDLMVQRSAEAARDMIEHARQTTSVWTELMGGLKGAGAAVLTGGGDPRGGSLFNLLDFGKMNAGWQQGMADAKNSTFLQELTNTLHQFSDAYQANKAVDRGDLASASAQFREAQKQGLLPKELEAYGTSVLAGARRMLDDQTRDGVKTQFEHINPQKISSTAPPDRARADHSENQALQEALKIAKENTTEYQAQLQLQKQLGLGIQDAQKDHLKDLQIAQENAQYDLQKKQISDTIAKAEEAHNGKAAEASKQNLDDLEKEHKFKLDLLQMQSDAEKVVTKIAERQKDINTALTAQQAIFTAMQAGWKNSLDMSVEELTAATAQSLLLKSKVDLEIQLRDLSAQHASAATLELTQEQAKLALAQQLYDLRRKEFELQSSMTSGNANLLQQFGQELAYKSNDLAKQNPSWTRGAADGFVSGSDTGIKEFFAYLKNPDNYRQQHNGQGWTLKDLAYAISSTMYDSITNALTTQLTKMMTDGLKGALGIKVDDPQVTAQQEANNYLGQVVTGQSEGNTLLGQILDTLNLQQPGSLGETISRGSQNGGNTLQYPEAPQWALGTPGADWSKAADQSHQTADAVSKDSAAMSNSFTGAFALMAMGLTSSLASGRASIKDFVVYALEEFAVLYAMKSLLGFAGAANGVPAGNHADGGLIVGPGTGTSDSIPARLSNGEFVMTAATTAYYGSDFMAALNNRQIQPYANGGPVGGSRAGAAPVWAGASGFQWNGDINVNVTTGGNSGQGSTSSDISGDQAGAVGKLLANTVRQSVLDMAYSGELNKALQVGAMR